MDLCGAKRGCAWHMCVDAQQVAVWRLPWHAPRLQHTIKAHWLWHRPSHADLKCDNILVNGTSGVVKLADLGAP